MNMKGIVGLWGMGTIFMAASGLACIGASSEDAKRVENKLVPEPNVHALFHLGAPADGPFPSDWFTVGDETQITRRRINLPKPDCAQKPFDCSDLDLINSFDGFNLQTRLSVP